MRLKIKLHYGLNEIKNQIVIYPKIKYKHKLHINYFNFSTSSPAERN